MTRYRPPAVRYWHPSVDSHSHCLPVRCLENFQLGDAQSPSFYSLFLNPLGLLRFGYIGDLPVPPLVKPPVKHSFPLPPPKRQPRCLRRPLWHRPPHRGLPSNSRDASLLHPFRKTFSRWNKTPLLRNLLVSPRLSDSPHLPSQYQSK